MLEVCGYCVFMSIHVLSKLMHVAGVIDADYRGNVGVILFNHAQTAYSGTGQRAHFFFNSSILMINISACTVVKKGDRVAQLILEQIVTPAVEEVAVCLRETRLPCSSTVHTFQCTSSQDLDSTARGASGFGSTGTN